MKIRRKQYRFRKKINVLKSRLFWSLLLSLVIAATAFYFLVFSDFFQIKEIVITGSEKIPKEALKEYLEENWQREIFFLKTDSIFLAQTSKSKIMLLQKFAPLESVEIKKTYPETVEVNVRERNEAGIFCRNESCFFMDSLGVIFSRVEDNLEMFPLTIFQNQTLVNDELVLGKNVFGAEILKTILKTAAKLKDDFGISVENILLVSDDRLNIKLSEGWEIYFNPKKDLVWQSKSLMAILEEIMLPEKRRELEYIDVRFDKIFIFPELKN